MSCRHFSLFFWENIFAKQSTFIRSPCGHTLINYIGHQEKSSHEYAIFGVQKTQLCLILLNCVFEFTHDAVTVERNIHQILYCCSFTYAGKKIWDMNDTTFIVEIMFILFEFSGLLLDIPLRLIPMILLDLQTSTVITFF